MYVYLIEPIKKKILAPEMDTCSLQNVHFVPCLIFLLHIKIYDLF